MLSLSRVLAVTVTALALRAPRPPLRVRSGTVRNGVSAAAEAAAQISSGLEAFEAAKSSTEVGLALTKIYSALPLDDASLDAFGPDSLSKSDVAFPRTSRRSWGESPLRPTMKGKRRRCPKSCCPPEPLLSSPLRMSMRSSPN